MCLCVGFNVESIKYKTLNLDILDASKSVGGMLVTCDVGVMLYAIVAAQTFMAHDVLERHPVPCVCG